MPKKKTHHPTKRSPRLPTRHRYPQKQSTRRHRRTRANPRNTEAGIRIQPTPAAQPSIRPKRRRR